MKNSKFLRIGAVAVVSALSLTLSSPIEIPASQQDVSMEGLSEQSQFVANNEQIIMGSKILERKKFERELKSEIVALKNDIDVDSVIRFATLCTLFAGGAMVLNYIMASVNEKSEKKEDREEKDRKLKMKM